MPVSPLLVALGGTEDRGILASAANEEEEKAVHAKYGETEYSIRALPLGGFVKVLGMEPGDEAVAPDEPRAFFNRPVSARMAIIASQNRSSSMRSSDSVGSIIRVPATGNDMVGAWKP